MDKQDGSRAHLDIAALLKHLPGIDETPWDSKERAQGNGPWLA